MDFTPLLNEVMKAGPWALLSCVFLWIAYCLFQTAKPVVAKVVEAHLSYLASVDASQKQIHKSLENQAGTMQQNNAILDRLDQRLQQHQEEKLQILSDHTKMLTMIHQNQNHKATT